MARTSSPLGLHRTLETPGVRPQAAVLPDDLPVRLSLAVMDVCGAPALTARTVRKGAVVAVIGAAGKSGSLSAAAARRAGAAAVIGIVPTEAGAGFLRHLPLV